MLYTRRKIYSFIVCGLYLGLMVKENMKKMKGFGVYMTKNNIIRVEVLFLSSPLPFLFTFYLLASVILVSFWLPVWATSRYQKINVILSLKTGGSHISASLDLCFWSNEMPRQPRGGKEKQWKYIIFYSRHYNLLYNLCKNIICVRGKISYFFFKKYSERYNSNNN